MVGLGYVGLPVAVAFGKTHPVVGFDIKPARIAELQAGRSRANLGDNDGALENLFVLLSHALPMDPRGRHVLD